MIHPGLEAIPCSQNLLDGLERVVFKFDDRAAFLTHQMMVATLQQFVDRRPLSDVGLDNQACSPQIVQRAVHGRQIQRRHLLLGTVEHGFRRHMPCHSSQDGEHVQPLWRGTQPSLPQECGVVLAEF